MPTLVLLAGPNGAGKTTFLNRFLHERAEAFQFVNPASRSFSPFGTRRAARSLNRWQSEGLTDEGSR